jgi:hypothetical protein
MKANIQNKKCLKCKQVKDTTEFYIDKSRKDGFRLNCKKCCSIYNCAKWKADKTSKIYSITNPIGYVYIGYTKMDFSKRVISHRAHYKKTNGILPLLHNSFNLYGIDNHSFAVVYEFEADKYKSKLIESKVILEYKQKGISLNVLS